MAWQDLIIALGNVVFTIALIPSVVGKDKPPLATSLPTSITLYVFALTFTTLNLWTSTVLTAAVATLWLILAIQKYKKRK